MVRAILISSLIGVSLAALFFWQLGSERRWHVNDIDESRLQFVCNAYAEIYAKTGLLFTTLKDFEQSNYFPYREGYSSSEMRFRYRNSDRRLETQVQYTGTGIRFVDLIIAKGKTRLANECSCPGQIHEPEPTPQISKAEITKRRAELYASGVLAVKDHFALIRKRVESGSLYNAHFHEKPLPTCAVADFPRNQDELNAYTDWLKALWQTEELVDGEGKPFIFSLRGGKLMVGSSKLQTR